MREFRSALASSIAHPHSLHVYKVLIANRGEIACRIIRTLDRMGMASVAVYSEADAHSAHVAAAGEAVCIGPAPAAQSYLRGDYILEAALKTGAQAIHPGYGFLSENADFAAACSDAGVVFIGPTPQQMRSFGLKHTARALAEAAACPCSPAARCWRPSPTPKPLRRAIGFPVMLKSTAGGGGIGMRLCHAEGELDEAFAAVRRLGTSNFKHAGMYLEKYVQHARHIEVQIFGDGQGHVLALGERDCSVQRRNQKVIEETPAPGISPDLRRRLFEAAVKLGEAVGYQSAGTVEFIFDADTDAFYFLEVNTRLQVEHGVTEEVTGIDLVEWMLAQAAGEMASLRVASFVRRGRRSRCASTPRTRRRISSLARARSQEVVFPQGARCDTWVERGIGGHRLLRPAPGQDHREGGHPRARGRADAVGAGAMPRRGHRDQPRIPATNRRRPRRFEGRVDYAVPRLLQVSPADRSTC